MEEDELLQAYLEYFITKELTREEFAKKISKYFKGDSSFIDYSIRVSDIKNLMNKSCGINESANYITNMKDFFISMGFEFNYTFKSDENNITNYSIKEFENLIKNNSYIKIKDPDILGVSYTNMYTLIKQQEINFNIAKQLSEDLNTLSEKNLNDLIHNSDLGDILKEFTSSYLSLKKFIEYIIDEKMKRNYLFSNSRYMKKFINSIDYINAWEYYTDAYGSSEEDAAPKFWKGKYESERILQMRIKYKDKKKGKIGYIDSNEKLFYIFDSFISINNLKAYNPSLFVEIIYWVMYNNNYKTSIHNINLFKVLYIINQIKYNICCMYFDQLDDDGYDEDNSPNFTARDAFDDNEQYNDWLNN